MAPLAVFQLKSLLALVRSRYPCSWNLTAHDVSCVSKAIA